MQSETDVFGPINFFSAEKLRLKVDFHLSVWLQKRENGDMGVRSLINITITDSCPLVSGNGITNQLSNYF